MSVIHSTASDLAGKAVTVDLGQGPFEYRVEDWWDRVAGMSWLDADGNPAALEYAVRAGLAGMPLDDAVLYGKDPAGFGRLVHLSEVRS
ncbi:hypothetical protein [Nocardia otitidiscaviarum]|uniref:hypothetical protein n=1 Tax=Nocardia otitidiscaviarum TaxID=1823 RepID=UPI0004A6EBE5|nr:hypothetical protein [Nocardia otitidiscaviarum]